WAADVAVEHFGVVAERSPRLEGVTGIQAGGVAVDQELAVKFVGTGFREDFNAAIPKMVVFRRKGILVDADFPNRLFRRQLSACKTIDVNLAAVWPRRRASESL